jgi:hypothetical protein
VAAVCKETCKHSAYLDADHLTRDVPLGEFADAYNRRLDVEFEAHFNRRVLGRQQRRLGTYGIHELTYTANLALVSENSLAHAYHTFYRGMEGALIDQGFYPHLFNESCDAADGPTLGVCDPNSLLQPVDASIEFSCEKSAGFVTTSYTYCPWVNIDVPSNPALVAESCFANPARDGVEDDTADSNALCAPRETCEALCLAMDECIGVDMVIDKPRCYLNRKHDSFCSEDEVYDYSNGTLTPPVGWYHPQGTQNYPDGHVPETRRKKRALSPKRRLVGETLWHSMHHKFLRKVKDQELVYRTQTDLYCRAKNVNITDAAPLMGMTADQLLCSSKCGNPDSLDEYEKGMCDEIDLSDDETTDFAICGVTRETCEALCTAAGDACVGFDMHKSAQRCWLNTEACGVDSLRNALDHDLVTKEHAAACKVAISGPGPQKGTYVQESTESFVSVPANGHVLSWTGCYWSVAEADTHEMQFLITKGRDPPLPGGAPLPGGETTCGDIEVLADGYTWAHWSVAKLNAATCALKGMDVSFHCITDEMCHMLGYCMLSPERLEFELAEFRGETLAAQDMPLCMIHTVDADYDGILTSIREYEPKVVASSDYLEAIFDMGAGGGQTSGHYMNKELFRDDSNFRMRIKEFPPGFGMGSVTMVAGAAAGAGFLPPLFYHDWQTDIMKIELFDDAGINLGQYVLDADGNMPAWISGPEQVVKFEVHLPSPVIFFLKSATDPNGGWTKAGFTVEESPGAEPGWYMITIPLSTFLSVPGATACSYVYIAGTMDIDECKHVDDCEENAKCVNVVGGEHKCVCKDGWKQVGEECVATEWMPHTTKVRIENDATFTTGWRVQEVKLYSDDTCETELVIGHGPGYAGWSWAKFDDQYLPGQNMVFDEASACTKCSAYAAEGPCSGYLPSVDDSGSSMAMCLTFPECQKLCADNPDCIGFDMHDYLPRCYMNTGEVGNAAVDPALRGEDVHYDLYLKQMTVSSKSSSNFEWHTPDLVLDDSLNSEWWSASFRKGPLEEYLEIAVTAPTVVMAARVMQRAGNDVDSYRVSLELSGHADSLDTPGKHVQHAESGAQIEDRSKATVTSIVTDAAGTSPCVSLTCGKQMFFSTPGKELTKPFHDVPSACHCKQLCLDHVDEGCRSWLYAYEKDSNFYSDPATHVHGSCTLYSVGLNKHKAKPSKWALAGDVDLILQGMTPTTATLGKFSLTIHGAGFPEQTSKQRIKVVPNKGADTSCDDAPVAEAVGLSCSSPYVCHPQPAEAGPESASWMIELMPSAATDFKVCYCAGVCFSSGQWTLVPGTLAAAPTTGVGFSTDPDELTTATGTFTVSLTADVHEATIIPAYDASCATADGTSPGFNVVKNAGDDYGITVTTATYGSYIVCAKDAADTDYYPVGAEEGPFLTISPTDDDAVRAAGIFRNAGSWSVRNGATAYINVAGSELDTFNAPRIGIAGAGESCGGVYLSPASFNLAPTATEADLLAFELDVPEDLATGKYAVCFCSDGLGGDEYLPQFVTGTYFDLPMNISCELDKPAGQLVVTRRVDTGKDYVLDPHMAAAGDVSIEITGTELDWRKDRIMIANCHDTCGKAGPTDYAMAEDIYTEQLAVNDQLYANDPKVDEPYTVDGSYQELPDRYCRQNNLDGKIAPGETGDVETTLITSNLCYDKCAADPSAPFCDGFYQGFDTPDSAALCLPRTECEHLCTLLKDKCYGIDMHDEYNRCFLNGPGCAAQVGAETTSEGLGQDMSYTFLMKELIGARKLQSVHVNWAGSNRGKLVMLPGVSTKYNLRFNKLTFTSAGTYKVCFCDSEMGACSKPSDFAVDVGQVHVSGVHCLLTVPKLRATTCYEQYYNGLSCADKLPKVPAADETGQFPSSYNVFPSP